MAPVPSDPLTLTFETVLAYERAHQAVLQVLFHRTPLAHVLVGRAATRTRWEPARGLFDLAVDHAAGTTFVELKVDSPLSARQLQRQSDHVRVEGPNRDSARLYVLLGLTAFEHDDDTLGEDSGPDARAVDALALAAAVKEAVGSDALPSDVVGMGEGYARALRNGHATLRTDMEAPSHHAHPYLVYEAVRRLAGVRSRMYSSSNPSGPVRILNDREWHRVSSGAKLYQEFNGGRLALKVEAEHVPVEDRVALRTAVRSAARDVLGRVHPGVDLVDGGRTGAYMTALYVGSGPATMGNAGESAHLFRAVHDALPDIAAAVG